jgi:hypothetical protein
LVNIEPSRAGRFRDFGGKERFVQCETLDGADQMALRVRFQQITAGAGLEQLRNQRFIVVHGEDQHFRLRQAGSDLARCLDAVDQGQRIVEHGDVGPGFGGLADGVLAIADLGNDFPIGLRFEDFPEPRTNDLVVVCDENTDHGLCLERGLSTI